MPNFPNINPMQILKMFIGNNGDPQQLVMNALNLMGGRNNKDLTMIMNLVDLAKNGDEQSVMNFANNWFSGQGRDFNSEFSEFMKGLNLNK